MSSFWEGVSQLAAAAFESHVSAKCLYYINKRNEGRNGKFITFLFFLNPGSLDLTGFCFHLVKASVEEFHVFG